MDHGSTLIGAPGPTVKTALSPEGVLEIALSRPTVHNAIDRELSSALLTALEEARSDREIRATLLRGEGPSFSSGHDLGEVASDDDAARLQEICRALRSGPPAIAVVHGYAIGGGAEIAFACDFIIASSRATFRLPEVKVGLAPGGGVSMFLVMAVGPSRAARLLLLGESLSAQEAQDAGLVHCVEEESQLLGRARDLAQTLARSDPAAIQRAKACLHSAWADLYETAYRSERKMMVEASHARWPHGTPNPR